PLIHSTALRRLGEASALGTAGEKCGRVGGVDPQRVDLDTLDAAGAPALAASHALVHHGDIAALRLKWVRGREIARIGRPRHVRIPGAVHVDAEAPFLCAVAVIEGIVDCGAAWGILVE